MLKKITAFILLAGIAVGSNFGIGFIAGNIIKNVINKHAKYYLGMPVSAGRVTVNPVFGRITIHSVLIGTMTTRSLPADVQVKKIFIDFEWMPVFFRKLIIEHMRIEEPSTVIRCQGDNDFVSIPACALASFDILTSTSAQKKKYPPVTFEHTELTGGSLGIIDGENRIDFCDVHIQVTRLWQSLDRRHKEINFSAESFLKEYEGNFSLQGSYSFDDNAHSFSGDMTLNRIDVRAVYPFIRKYLPVSINRGYLSVTGRPICSGGNLNTILQVNVDQLDISPIPDARKTGGISVPMMQEFLRSTNGTLRSDLHIMGTLDHPEFQWNDFFAQIFSRKMLRKELNSINQKASQAVKDISDLLKNSRKVK